MSDSTNRLPTIPQYFKEHVDNSIDLEVTPSIRCPFHGETSGKSFSYSRNLAIFRCWGACHTGGDVIELHRLNYKFKTRDEARESLYNIYGLNVVTELKFEKEDVKPDLQDAYRRRLYSLAINVAKEPADWLDLDYIVSQVPFSVEDLEAFVLARGVTLTMPEG